jgi:hypothetical protein
MSGNRLPISVVNAVLVSSFLLGAVSTAVLRNWPATSVLGALGVFGLAGALYARRDNARDITRVNAIEYRDERDRTVARNGFAVVGAVALVLSVVQVVVSTALTEHFWFAYAQLVVLSVTWSIANSLAVRRG